VYVCVLDMRARAYTFTVSQKDRDSKLLGKITFLKKMFQIKVVKCIYRVSQ